MGAGVQGGEAPSDIRATIPTGQRRDMRASGRPLVLRSEECYCVFSGARMFELGVSRRGRDGALDMSGGPGCARAPVRPGGRLVQDTPATAHSDPDSETPPGPPGALGPPEVGSRGGCVPSREASASDWRASLLCSSLS